MSVLDGYGTPEQGVVVSNKSSADNAVQEKLFKQDNPFTYLTYLGITEETIQDLNLSLSKPYELANGKIQVNALQYYIHDKSGESYKVASSKLGFYNLDGLTENPTAKSGWSGKYCLFNFINKNIDQKSIIIVENIIDAAIFYQYLMKWEKLNSFIICHPTQKKLYFAEDADFSVFRNCKDVFIFIPDLDEVKYIVDRIGVDCNYVQPKTGSYSTFFSRYSQLGFSELLLNSETIKFRLKSDSVGAGRFSSNPVNINGAYVNGYMYYPVQTILKEHFEDAHGNTGFTEKLETVVIRSDRKMFRAVVSKAPKNTPDSLKIVRLTDGTQIDSVPKRNSFSTWRWEHIEKFLNEEEEQSKTEDLFNEIKQIFMQSVWLPQRENYTVLALTVMLSYVQNIFKSVPYIYLNGAAGTGKSQTGKIVSLLSFNAVLIGQISAASAARLIDESRGCVVLDDLEAIGNKKNDGSQFSELIQALKVSYNKRTAEKVWTDTKTMKIEKLNFFGVKVISNTQGVDETLATRMIRIQTKKIPETIKQQALFSIPTDSDLVEFENLRQRLHAWAFNTCDKIHGIVKECNVVSDRLSEIALPLRVIAELISEDCQSDLTLALARQTSEMQKFDEATENLLEACKNILQAGYSQFALPHLVSELSTLMDSNFGISNSNEIAEWMRPEWVGKKLRTLGIIEIGPGERKTHAGKKVKILKFSKDFLEENQLHGAQQSGKEPFDFCSGKCNQCQYRSANCVFTRFKQ